MNEQNKHLPIACTRRDFLFRAGTGFGGLALASLLAEDAEAQGKREKGKGKSTPAPQKAKSVIFLFMVGGPSQMETFDPKPALKRLQGQPMPKSFGTEIKSQFLTPGTPILDS